jgi:hypothetical protein
MADLYTSMAEHPDTGQVMQLLALVDPVDEFSRALCLVRDCFDPNPTLRILSRNKLRGLLSQRLALLRAYESAVIDAVPGAKTFSDAILLGDRATVDRLRENFEQQAAVLMGRKLG